MKLFIIAILILVSQSIKHRQLFDVINDQANSQTQTASIDQNQADSINMMEKSQKKFDTSSVFGSIDQEPITRPPSAIVKETVTSIPDEQQAPNINEQSDSSLALSSTETESTFSNPEEANENKISPDKADVSQSSQEKLKDEPATENQNSSPQGINNITQNNKSDLQNLKDELEALLKESDSLQNKINETKTEAQKIYDKKKDEIKNFILKVDERIDDISQHKVTESQKLIDDLSKKESNINEQLAKGQSLHSQASSNYKGIEKLMAQVKNELAKTSNTKVVSTSNAAIKGKLLVKGLADLNALQSDHIIVGSVKFDNHKLSVPSSTNIEIGSHSIQSHDLIKVYSSINSIQKKCKSALIGCILLKDDKEDKKDMIKNLERIKEKVRTHNQYKKK